MIGDCPLALLPNTILPVPQVRFRERITILRGNHESRQITQVSPARARIGVIRASNEPPQRFHNPGEGYSSNDGGAGVRVL